MSHPLPAKVTIAFEDGMVLAVYPGNESAAHGLVKQRSAHFERLGKHHVYEVATYVREQQQTESNDASDANQG